MNKSCGRSLRVPFLDVAAWRYFLNFYKGQHRRLAITALVSAAQSLFIVPTLLLVRYAFDKAIPQKNIQFIILIGIGIFVFRLANSGIALWTSGVSIRVITTSISDLREDLLKRMYRFSRNVHTRLDQKTTHARIVQDTERLSNLSNALVSRFLPSLLSSLALCIILLVLNWKLFLIMMSLFPFLFLSNRYMGKLVKEKVYIFQRAFERFSKGTAFVLRYMDLTKIQTAHVQEIDRQAKILEELRKGWGTMAFIYAINGQTQALLTGMSGVIILIVGGILAATQSITIGEFISFYVAAGYLNGHVNAVTASVADIIAGNESIVTLQRLAMAHDVQPYLGKRRIQFGGFLSFESVAFRYDEQPVLENITFSMRPGSKVAIIGSNGAGKSTIIQLILGFYRPKEGRLYADTVPYEELDISHLRRSMGVVTQSPQLFSGTILENISYGTPVRDIKEIIVAAQHASADEFIRQLPDAYETQIGEDGILLSGGECQRIAIARALLRRPKLLILDEPTNHLDRTAVENLMDRLDQLDSRPAILIISHDVSCVDHAGEVYHLENGMLIPCAPVSIRT
jgi:ABC-type multidrug transport system fused ATPase/permease subunit